MINAIIISCGGEIMYLHLGGDTVIPMKKVIAIFDIENTTISTDTKDFLRQAAKTGRTENVSDDMPKSYVLTKDKHDFKVFITSISATTLYKRNMIGGGY